LATIMYFLNIVIVFIRDQIRGFPALHRRLTDFVYADIVRRHPPVLSAAESIDIIVRDNASVGRYGDGEYRLCRNKPLRFQKNTEELTARLRAILYGDTPNFHAAVASPSAGVERAGWKDTLVHNYRIIAKLDDRPRLNAFLSTASCQNDIDRMKRIWQNRKTVLITNTKTRKMAVGCDIFSNASSQDFIEAPGAEAFDAYPTLLQHAKRYSNDTLFLLACGPTATVLAHELHLCGYQAVDIGHFIHHSFRCLRRQ